VLVTADDVKHGKPDAEPYRRGAELLGFEPSACLVVEDAPAGIRAGHAAGMRVISLPTTCAIEELREADAIVSGLAEIQVSLNGVGRQQLLVRVG